MAREAHFPNPSARFLSVAEVATLLGLSVRHLRREIVEGHLTVHRFGKAVRISREDLDAYVRARRSAWHA
jgi:excisionase family DNA binding protein